MRYEVTDLRLFSSDLFLVDGKKSDTSLVGKCWPQYWYELEINSNKFYKVTSSNSPCYCVSIVPRIVGKYNELVEKNSSEWIRVYRSGNKFYIDVVDCAHQLLELEMKHEI